MSTYKEVLKNAKSLTRKTGKETSATELLFLNFSGLSQSELYLRYDLKSLFNKEYTGSTDYRSCIFLWI